MKVALAHDWLVHLAGSERVLESMHALYPGPIHTLLCDPAAIRGSVFEAADVRPSFLQRLPGAVHHHRSLLPLFPLAMASFDLSDFDLVLSSSHAAAKSVRTRPGQLHICYSHTPMRYAWDLLEDYIAPLDPLKRVLARRLLLHLRGWDRRTARGVDHFLANSAFTADRIRRCYGRTATVLHPPVEVERFRPAARKGRHFVTVSRLVRYKRVDAIVAAFNRLGLPLIVVGRGPERDSLAVAAGPNVEIAGELDDRAVAPVVAEARGFVIAAVEDFGIAPVEAQAAGTPVVALGRGGALETVVDGETGTFFPEQSPEAIAEAVKRLLRLEDRIDPARLRAHAERFSRPRFERAYRAFVEARLRDRGSAAQGPSPPR